MKYNSIGEQLIAKAKELDPSYKPDKFNDMSEALDVILNNTSSGSGGGKSVPPTLNLADLENGGVRTTITEEEKTNLENGLYNQVMSVAGDDLSMYSPSKLFSAGGEYYFTQFKIVANTDETISYSSMAVNSITIGEKNTSNEYPITVTEEFTINPPSASGGGPLLDMFPYWQPSTQTVTQEGFNLLTQKLLSNEIVGISLGDAGTCMLLDNMKGTSISFIGPYSGDHGRFKATFNFDLSVKTEYVDKGGSPISLTLPQTAPSSQVIPSITTTNTQQNLTIGDGLVIENGVLKSISSGGSGEKILIIPINDILTDNSKIQELFSKMTSTTEQSALILFDNPISYDTYKDYDTIKLYISPLLSLSVSGYYILKNQSHINGYTPIYSLTTAGFNINSNNLDKLVIKHLIIAGNDEVNSPLNKFLLKIL